MSESRTSEQCAHENATPDRPEPTSEWTCADCGVRLWLPEQYAQRSSKDLLSRLRSYSPRSGYSRVMRDAADEIERLRKLVPADETPACRCVELGYTCPTCCAASVATAAHSVSCDLVQASGRKCSCGADVANACLARRVSDDTPLPRCDQYPRCPCGGPEGNTDVATAAPRASWIDRDGNEHVDDTGLESDKPF
jgi:hypothetical protein